MTVQHHPILEHWAALEADLTRFYGIKPEHLPFMSWRRFTHLTTALYALENSVWRQMQEVHETDGWTPPQADTTILDGDAAAAFLQSISRVVYEEATDGKR